MTDITDLRKEIDRINIVILNSLLERQNISIEIAKYKAKNNLEILDKNREKIVLNNIASKAVELGLNQDIVKEIFVKIMELSKETQRKTIINKNRIILTNTKFS